MSDAQKHSVAEYLSGSPVGQPRAPIAPTCTGVTATFDRNAVPTTQGWGQTPDNAHFVPAATAKLAARRSTTRAGCTWPLIHMPGNVLAPFAVDGQAPAGDVSR